MLGAILAGLLCPGVAAAQTPDMTDPLRGDRRLLPLDDILFFNWSQQDGAPAAPFVNINVTSENGFDSGPQAQPSMGQPSTFGLSAGRMFAVPRDTLAVAVGDQMSIYIGPQVGGIVPAIWSGAMPNSVQDAHTEIGALNRPLMAMADFTGDGYEELVIGTAGGGLQVASAVDVTDPGKGLNWGDLYSGVDTIPGSALTTGDFDGNGLAEVALAYPDSGSPATGFTVEIYKVDPSELWLAFEQSVTVNSSTYGEGSFPIRKVSISAGDFDSDVSDLGLPDEEIVVTLSGEDGNDTHFAIQTFEVFSTLQPVATYGEIHTTADFVLIDDACGSNCPYVSTAVESARIDWTGSLEQVVVGINSLLSVYRWPVSQFWILSFDGDDDLEFDIVTRHSFEDQQGPCTATLRSLAIGNFDRPAQGEPATIPDSLSIAVLQGHPGPGAAVTCPAASWMYSIFTVDPSNDFSVSDVSSWEGSNNLKNTLMVLATGDWKGGSLWLGPPQIVPLQDLAQLEVVLQAPPMHMDFIEPIDETSADLLNLSFGLPGFNTKFTESSGTSTSTSHQSTASHAFAEKESLEDSLSFGVPDVASVSVDLQTSSEQTQQQVVSQSSNTITSTLSSLATASDLDDRVWYTAHDTDLYIYPVLCPPDPDNPDACGTTPSDVMFSLPQSQTVYSFVPGASVEWYQPPHQVAQALSYPWTKTQLADLFPTASLDTKLEVDNLPAAGPLNTTFEWTGVGETTQSIGKTRTLSFDTSVSISTDVNAEIDIFSLGGKTKESFSFNTSSSASTLNTSESKITGSIGFATSVPDAADVRSGSNPDYAYDFGVLVFGQTHPPCATASAEDQDAASDEASSSPTCVYDSRTLTEEITTQGTLWAGYTVDLTDGGSWWTSSNTDYFSLHDIALGHPQRWVRDASQSSGDNCLLDSSSSTQLCYVQSATSLQPEDIWTNEFYRMKGFFVLPAAESEANQFLVPQGPQTAVINADGQVWLQARLHNYSFVATDQNGDGAQADNSVHVRFYAQEWDHVNNVPLAGTQSILVEEIVLDECIPGHGATGKAACSDGGTDNWALATTSKPFDPVAAGIDPGTSGTYVLFWVVAWMEGPDGSLVPEVAEHGLTGLPGNLTSLTSAASLSQTYGNNIGFFPLPTFVCPPGVDCSNVSASAQQNESASNRPDASSASGGALLVEAAAGVPAPAADAIEARVQAVAACIFAAGGKVAEAGKQKRQRYRWQ